WKNVVTIQDCEEHFKDSGWSQIRDNTRGAQAGGVNEKMKSLALRVPNTPGVFRPTVNLPDILNPYWLSGFTAGDGSFM
ncbi:hypothetical protein HK100_004105, partial [Physocladia obscura]